MTTRRTGSLALTAIAFLLAASGAQALPSVSLLWRGNGQDTLSSASSTSRHDVEIVEVVFTADSVGSLGIFLSFAFDPSELLVLGAREFREVALENGDTLDPILFPATTIDNGAGTIQNFELVTLGTGMNPFETATLGSIRFFVKAASGDASDIDVLPNLDNIGIDAILSGTGEVICQTGDTAGCQFNGASMTVPEPGTALLVGLGLVAVGWTTRRAG